MNFKNLGIGLVVLSATLFSGITINEILNLKDLPEIVVAEEVIDAPNIETLKDCEPKNKNLKYQNLPYIVKEKNYMKIDEGKLPDLTPVSVTSENKKQSAAGTKKETSENSRKKASETYIPLPAGDLSGDKTLVHKEICRERSAR